MIVMHLKTEGHRCNTVIALENTLLLVCPDCGNDKAFVEVADQVILTTRFVQNDDGSFSQEEDDSQILGEVKFYCGDCGADLSMHQKHFLEMLF